MTTLNKNYQEINGAVDKVNDIPTRHNTSMTQIEADMGTIETNLTRLDNTSGTNTGDETVSTIKTKLGITTLSGSNTGDQTISDATITTTDITTNDASITKHGFLKKLSNNSGQFLNGVGDWAAPSGSGDVLGPATNSADYIPQWDGANSKTLKNGVTVASLTPPVKASSAEITTGTDDAKFATAKAIKDAGIIATPVKASGAEIVTGTEDGKFVTPKAILDANIFSQAWTAWSPTWSNLTVGSGTVSGAYTRIGKTVIVRLGITLAADSSIAGSVSITLPVTSVSYPGTATVQTLGNATLHDNGTAQFAGRVLWGSTTSARIVAENVAGTYNSMVSLSSTIPFTWTTNDQIHLTFMYEAA